MTKIDLNESIYDQLKELRTGERFGIVNSSQYYVKEVIFGKKYPKEITIHYRIVKNEKDGILHYVEDEKDFTKYKLEIIK